MEAKSDLPEKISMHEIYMRDGIEYREDFSRCEEMLYVYYPYWKRDSLGLNGFRMIYAEEKLVECLKNQKWADVEKYLGTPFYKGKGDYEGTYRYKLSYISDGSMGGPGTLLLWVEVKDSLVKDCWIHEIDG